MRRTYRCHGGARRRVETYVGTMVLLTALLFLVAVLSLHTSAAGGSSMSVNPTPTPTPTSPFPNGLTLLDLQRQAVVFTVLDMTIIEWSSVESAFTDQLAILSTLYCTVHASDCNLTVSANFNNDDVFYLPGYPTVLEVSNIQIAMSLLLPWNNMYPILPQNMVIDILLGGTLLLQDELSKILTGITAFSIPVETTTSTMNVGHVSSSVYSTPSPTPPPPTQRPTTVQEWEENAITLLLGQVSVEDWNASTYLQQTFKEVMAEEASVYCSSTPALCRIDIPTSRRRAASSVTFSESDVIFLPGYPKDFEVHLQVVFAIKVPDTVALLDSASVPLLPQPVLLAISLETTAELATRTGVHILAVGPYQPPAQPGSNVGLTVGISVFTVIVLLGFMGISVWLLVTVIRTRRTQDMYDPTNYIATESPNVELLSYKPLVTDTVPHDLERHFTAVDGIDIDIDIDWTQNQ